MLLTPLRAAGGAALLAAGGGAAYAYASFRREFGEEALPRLVTAYSVAIPGFAAYKAVQLRHERLPRLLGLPVDEAAASAAYEALHEEWAPRGLDVILRLRGFNLKTGQMVASNFGNVFPEKWQGVFEVLLDAVPPKPFAHGRATVEAGLGRALEEVFSSFEQAPIGSASIGQVHRATLRDGGKAVVVKVMYPEVEGQFRGDLFAAKRFAAVALPEHVKPLEEIEKQFANEFDYRREAAQLASIRGNLARSGLFPEIVVPAPLPALCSKAVLVMEEVPNAKKLTAELREDMAFFAAQRGMTLDALLAEERALNREALARGELRCGPSAAQSATWAWQLGWANFLGRLVGRAPQRVPLNHAALLDELLRVHAHEVLVDGAFNGDPHPGNLLITRPQPGSQRHALALIDYGQVKELTLEERLKVARLMVALARADEADAAQRAGVARLLRDTGFATARNDPDVIFENARLFFDRDDPLVTRGLNTQAYIEELQARDATKTLGDAYVLVARCSLMLRGLGHLLNQHRSAAKAWAPTAEKVLREAGEDPAQVLPRAVERAKAEAAAPALA